MGFSILVVDDEASMRDSLARLLRAAGYAVRVADSGRAALDEAQKEDPHLVLLDICLPDTSGLDVLTQLKETNRRIVVIAMTAYDCTKDAVQAMKRGAYDYLSKPFNIDALRLLVKQALECGRDGKQADTSDAWPWQGSACDRMIATSPVMRRVLDIIHRLPGNSSSNLLIEGETGTGKELLARAVHEVNSRVAEPFVAIGCGAIPRDLMESELFGYEKGAFTGARAEGKQGAFEQAARGTIFLDEIGELDLNLQVKLLRVLEAREFRRVGGLSSIPLRAHIIAATNRFLRQEVDRERFRADLYYRLNVVKITLPPLRERRGDIIPLAKTFLRKFNALFGKRFETISPTARKLLEDCPWDGNVRELRNVIERAVLLESGDTILPEHLFCEHLDSDPSAACYPHACDSSSCRLSEVEKDRIAQALRRTGGNVVKAARLLGLNRGALRYRMDKHAITKDVLQEIR